MSFDTLFTLIIIGGMGYMMFRGGGCCGSHGGHGKHQGDGEKTGETTGETTGEATSETAGAGLDDQESANR